MYTPTLKVKRNGVPIVKKEELDIIGERFVADFQPSVLEKPEPVDIDRFVEFYLGMTPDFQFLSHNGIYLGMTVFNDTSKVIIYDPVNNCADYISAKARTMIIDNRLLEENQHHRYRFTVGHEAGHDILHSGYFSYNPDQLTMFDDFSPMIQCRVDNCNSTAKSTRLWDDRDWMEWQANRLSSAILMPKSAVERIGNNYREHRDLKNPVTRCMLVAHVSGIFDVSIAAATYRLKDLGFIDQTDTTDYSIGTSLMDFAPVVASIS